MIAFISRKYGEKQTTGHLCLFDGDELVFGCKTLEPPWKFNLPFESCIYESITDQKYFWVEKHNSPTYGLCLKIKNVYGRRDILVHCGNYIKNTDGCVLVGRFFKDIDSNGLKDVIYSQDTFNKLMEKAPDKFKLIIRSDVE